MSGGRARQYASSAERARAWRERQKAATSDGATQYEAANTTEEEQDLQRIAELEDELAATKTQLKTQVAALTAARAEVDAARDALAAARDETAAQATAIADAREEAADLRTQAAVAAAQHAGELAALRAVADERLRQIDTLRADLAEARKAPVAAAQVPQKRERRPTSAEKFDPDVLHQEVLAKWFKYMDEHPNPVPTEERTRQIVRQLVAESKARDAAAPTPPEVQEPAPEAPEAPEVPVAAPGRRGRLQRHLRS